MMLHLKELRQKKHLTQLELSKALQISASSIGMYEQGRREPDNETLAKIADFFDVTIDYLLGRESSPTFNPPAGFFNDPEVGARVEQLRTNPKFRLLLCASKDLTSDVLNSLIALAEHYAKKHGMNE